MKYVKILIVFLTLSLSAKAPAALNRSVDEALLELELEQRVEVILDKLIGPKRSIVDVKITLQDIGANDIEKLKMLRRNIPGVSTKTPGSDQGASEEEEKNRFKLYAPLISTITVNVLVDESLATDKIDLIKQELPAIIGLVPKRGDELIVKPTPWREIPPEDMALQQFGVSKRNLIMLVVIAALIGSVVGFSLISMVSKKMQSIKADKIKADKSFSDKDFVNKMETGGANINDTLQSLGEAFNKIKGPEGGDTSTMIKDMIEAQKQMGEASTDRIVEALEGLKESLADLEGGGGGKGADGFGGAGGGGGAGGPGGPGGGEGLSKLAAEANDPTTKALYILSTLKADEILKILEDEDNQIKAVAVSHLTPEKSAEVLLALEEEMRNTLVNIISDIPEGDMESLKILKDFLDRKATVILHRELLPGNAAKSMAKMLSRSLPEVRKSVLDNIRRKNPKSAEDIEDNLFLFDDIKMLDAKTIKHVLSGIDRDVMIRALKKAENETKEVVLSTFTSRARAILEEDIEVLGDISLQESMKAQNTILDKIDALMDSGDANMAKAEEK